MSDFINSFWPWFIAVLTIISVLACGVLLWKQAQPKLVRSLDAESNSTGHVWDEDLKELNNPMPQWWMGLFVLTILFAGVYFLLYPALVVTDGTKGWTQIGQYQSERERVSERMTQAFAPFAGMPLPEIAAVPAAVEMGERIFLNNCATCHGSDARGSRGFPNLADRDWQWGGSPEAILTSIVDGRHGMMPPMAAAVGTDDDIRNVALYVLSLSGRPGDAVRIAKGQGAFMANCAACHGADGTGNTALGAPNLADRTWLHGGALEDVMLAIRRGREGIMPAHKDRLTAEQIQLVAAYVIKISGGGTPAQTAAAQ